MARSLDLELHHLRAVARNTADPWARDFARSILAQARRPKWEPSPKQVGIIRRLVNELFQPDDLRVVEDD